jgi:hypothetical protein
MHYPDGRYEIRLYENRKKVYKRAGDNAADAMAARRAGAGDRWCWIGYALQSLCNCEAERQGMGLGLSEDVVMGYMRAAGTSAA